MKSLLRHAAMLVAGALAVGCAHAGDGKAASKNRAEPATNAIESGIKIYVDPETGRTSSTPVTEEQKRAAANAMPAPDFSKIREIHKADGSIEWQFNGQVQEAVIATRDADGKLHLTCSEHGTVHAHEAAARGGTDRAGGRDVR